mmetsp:Transcript_40036/g.82002  ORF Transcript_40036/g.82002 Transcript_40036/m.82002 type:complete len:138 (-) Transcript_40036:78-491(-)
MYKGFDGAGLDAVKPVRKAQINGEDGVYVGSQGYVPRLVQVDLPWQRPPASGGVQRLSQKAPRKGLLKTLGDDCYAPSGIQLRPDDLVDTRFKTMPAGQTGKPSSFDRFAGQSPAAVFDGYCDPASLRRPTEAQSKP